MNVLMVDVGGTNVKLMATGHEGRRKVPSGKKLTASKLVEKVLKTTEDWTYDAVSVGIPSLVIEGKPAREPFNIGGGWLRTDFEKAFGKPVRFINDAAMQALANYQQGRMLFLGFGTSIGGAIVVDDVIVTMELGGLKLSKSRRFVDVLNDSARKKYGDKNWLEGAIESIELVRDVFKPDDIVLGGGNAKKIIPLPKGCRVRDNQAAFLGASRLWPGADMLAEPCGSSWRIKRVTEKKAKPGAKSRKKSK